MLIIPVSQVIIISAPFEPIPVWTGRDAASTPVSARFHSGSLGEEFFISSFSRCACFCFSILRSGLQDDSRFDSRCFAPDRFNLCYCWHDDDRSALLLFKCISYSSRYTASPGHFNCASETNMKTTRNA